MSGHEDLRRSLGSYVVGALDPAERSELEEHLASCLACREELAAYAGLPGLLSRLTVDEATGSALIPPASLLPRTLDVVEHERRRRSRSLHRWKTAAVGLAVAAAVAGLFAVLPGGREPAAAGRPLTAAAGVTSSGDLALEARPWGTSVRLRLQDLVPAESYTAWAVDDAGARSPVATWGPTPDGRADVTGATALPPNAVRSLVVITDDGQELLAW